MPFKSTLALIALSLSIAPLLYSQDSTDAEIQLRRDRAARAQARQDEFYRTRAYPLPAIPAGARTAAIGEMERMRSREIQAAKAIGRSASAPQWTLIGPRPTNVAPFNTNSGPPFSAGRVAALTVDPRDAKVVYLGAAGGGVWKTADGGVNWTPLTDNQPSMATGSIALAPSNPDVVYVGTGEQNNSSDSYYGAGILKSTNGGATWTQLGGPFVGVFSSSRVNGGGARIGGLAVDPANTETVLAAVSLPTNAASGIYRTTDGGANWTLVLNGAVGTEVMFNPSDRTVAYAALGSAGGNARNGVYKSTDGGATWTLSGGTGATALPTVGVGRIALALAPSNPNVLYVGIASSNGATLLGMFKSLDGAQSWTRLFPPDYCTGQCAYNNIIRVNPTNPNYVVAAGLPPYRSADGGVTWTSLFTGSNGLFPHTDHHALAFSSDGSRLYDGDDGGAYSTTTGSGSPGPWSNLNATLAITEFSSNVSIHPSDPTIAFGGTQDNGTQAYTGNLAWDQAVGGDGGWTAVDFAVPNIWYGSFFSIQPYKLSGVASLANIASSFGLANFILANGITGGGTPLRVLFYPPIVMDPSNPLRLYFATQRLFQTVDGMGTWAPISPDLAPNATISAIAISPASAKTIAVGTTSGKVQVTTTADQGGSATWTDVSAGLPLRSVSHVTFDPVNASTLYAAFSGFSNFIPTDTMGHVFRSPDLGATWTDISANLPNIPVNDLVVDPDLANTLYVATDIGVFQSTDGGQSWSTLSAGLPHVLVSALNLHRASRTLRAVTYGRSMWDLSVPLPGASQAPHIDAVSPASLAGGAGPVTVTLSGANFAATSAVRWNGSDRPTTFANGKLSITLATADLAAAGRATAMVFNPVAGGSLSNAVNVPVGPAPAATTGGTVSAANPSVSGTLVPGAIESIYGTSLAPGTVVAAAPPLPSTLGGVTVEINGTPAALYFVSPGQINFQTPWEVQGFDRATVSIINGTLTGTSFQVKVADAAPALFSTNGAGTGQGAVLIAGPEVVAAPAGTFPGSRPVQRGEFLEIFGTGLGAVSRYPFDGGTLSGLSITKTPAVTIGGAAATTVLYSGLTPGAVGLYQVNVQVPAGAATGDAVPVFISLSGVTSNSVTIAVR